MSSETKHTPGPWAVVVPPAGTMQRARVYGPSNPNDGGHYAPLCKLSNVSDARLIAAAPELLEAASRLFNLANHFHVGDVWFTDSDENREALEGLEAAIARATGQEG